MGRLALTSRSHLRRIGIETDRSMIKARKRNRPPAMTPPCQRHLHRRRLQPHPSEITSFRASLRLNPYIEAPGPSDDLLNPDCHLIQDLESKTVNQALVLCCDKLNISLTIAAICHRGNREGTFRWIVSILSLSARMSRSS